MDSNLYIDHNNIIILEVYVDGILFVSDDDKLSQGFAHDMQQEFEMSVLGEMDFFLVLAIS